MWNYCKLPLLKGFHSIPLYSGYNVLNHNKIICHYDGLSLLWNLILWYTAYCHFNFDVQYPENSELLLDIETVWIYWYFLHTNIFNTRVYCISDWVYKTTHNGILAHLTISFWIWTSNGHNPFASGSKKCK